MLLFVLYLYYIRMNPKKQILFKKSIDIKIICDMIEIEKGVADRRLVPIILYKIIAFEFSQD